MAAKSQDVDGPVPTIANQLSKKKTMNQKLLDQVMRQMETQACSAPRKDLSLARMQVRSGQRCIGCMGPLPPPHTPDLRYCTLCRPGARRHTVYVSFCALPSLRMAVQIFRMESHNASWEIRPVPR